MKKLTILLTTILLLILGTTFLSEPLSASDSNSVIDLSQFRKNTYQRVLTEWEKTETKYKGEDIVFSASEKLASEANFINKLEAVYIEKDEDLSFNVLINETGLYNFSLNFVIEEEFTTRPTIEFKVNDKFLYNELTNLELPVLWGLLEREEKDKYNRYGNELLPYTVSKTGEYEEVIIDSDARFSEPLWLKLTAGTNKITIKANNYSFYFKGLTFKKGKSLEDYQSYQIKHQNEQVINEKIKISSYLFDEKNEIEIRASYFKGAQLEKNAYKNDVLNILNGDSISKPGSTVNYHFSVEETGLYALSFKYLQNNKIGLSSGLSILIDNEIPFKELECYLFPYNKTWKNETLNKDGEPLLIYLEEGVHQLSLRTTSMHLTSYIDELYYIMDGINTIGLAVDEITGRSTDALIDWDILKYLPNIVDDLNDLANKIEKNYEEIQKIMASSRKSASLENLKIAAKQLRRVAKTPNKIANKLAELNKGSGSAYQLIGLAINDITNQNVSFENIYFHNPELKLPKANGNFFERLWFSIKAFFYSFVDERYKVSKSKEKDALDVWVGQSSLFVDIMQNLIDDEFSKETGIKVKLNVLPSSTKIILNNATNTNPDVVLSIDSWEPYAYALRGILSDLSKFDGFEEMVENVERNNFTPLIFEDGVYGMPESQSTYLLYYRKDIFDFLEINPPDTWEEIINILPILQSYRMNFFHPLGGEGAYKGFGLTSPIIYQFGGEIYSEDGFSTTFSDEVNIDAITFMTNIFNIYNLPEQVPSFFEGFRSGSLPVGISTSDLYLQLKYAAPELKGQWGVLPMPGMYDENLGEVARWAPTYGKASILFKSSSKQQEGFDLIKWWNKTETQLKFLQNIKMILGEKYLYLPANKVALEQSIWDHELKEQALLQAKWSRIPAVTPGSYIIERELTNIWNKIVIDHINPREAIDQAVLRINRELRRKFEEFGYIKGGEVIREYKVPRNDNIENWIP